MRIMDLGTAIDKNQLHNRNRASHKMKIFHYKVEIFQTSYQKNGTDEDRTRAAGVKL